MFRRAPWVVAAYPQSVFVWPAVRGTACAAHLIANRASLTALLGTAGHTEDFERFNVPANNAFILRDSSGNMIPNLDSTSIANGQGPGLVLPGITIGTAGGFQGLQWNGAGYFGQPSKDLISMVPGITITFDHPVTAFGLDLLTFSGELSSGAAIGIFDRTVGIERGEFWGISVPSAPPDQQVSPVFFGYYDPAGFNFITIGNTLQLHSIIIDNVTFGGVPSSGIRHAAGPTRGLESTTSVRRQAGRRWSVWA